MVSKLFKVGALALVFAGGAAPFALAKGSHQQAGHPQARELAPLTKAQEENDNADVKRIQTMMDNLGGLPLNGNSMNSMDSAKTGERATPPRAFLNP
ncbi:hypothetical protein K2X33_14330 [bacterium]|nr:hypothetical protein [bacterium]